MSLKKCFDSLVWWDQNQMDLPAGLFPWFSCCSASSEKGMTNVTHSILQALIDPWLHMQCDRIILEASMQTREMSKNLGHSIAQTTAALHWIVFRINLFIWAVTVPLYCVTHTLPYTEASEGVRDISTLQQSDPLDHTWAHLGNTFCLTWWVTYTHIYPSFFNSFTQ